jgi:hypothetical protein
MTKYLAGVLTVIAVGVVLIAYGLLGPERTAAFGPSNQLPYGVQPAYASGMQPAYGPGMQPSYPYGMQQPAYPYGGQQPYPYNNPYLANQVVAAPISSVVPVRTVETVQTVPARRRVVRTVERAPRRDWKKTALIIGGSSATGAGLGAIFGGKKGALIGAAIGGGASTIYETTKSRRN